MDKVTAIVLSAGLSQRMGEENKLFLPIDHKPMIEWVISNLFYCNIEEIVLVSSDFSEQQLKVYENTKLKVVVNELYEKGMTTSIQKGVIESKETNGYMICLGDQPLINANTYNTILHTFYLKYPKDNRCIIVPYHEDKKGNPVIFSSHYKAEILAHQDMEGCKEIIQLNKDHVYKVAIESPTILMDVDTKEDYENLL